jgi:DNA-binding NarL/FixJ family response regulator
MSRNPLDFLTKKEILVIDAMLLGHTTNSELARFLCYSESTIESRVSSILWKLGLNDRGKIILIGVALGRPIAAIERVMENNL